MWYNNNFGPGIWTNHHLISSSQGISWEWISWTPRILNAMGLSQLRAKTRFQLPLCSPRPTSPEKRADPLPSALLKEGQPALSGTAPAFSAGRIRLGDIFCLWNNFTGEISYCAESWPLGQTHCHKNVRFATSASGVLNHQTKVPQALTVKFSFKEGLGFTT